MLRIACPDCRATPRRRSELDRNVALTSTPSDDSEGVEMREDNLTFRFGRAAALAGMLTLIPTGCGKAGGEPAKSDGDVTSSSAHAKTDVAAAGRGDGAKSAGPQVGAAQAPNAAAPVTVFTGDQLIHDCEEGSFDSDKTSQDVFVAWFHADWCPSCEKQRRELEPLSRSSIKGRPVICRYDYDETADLQGKLRVQRQSSFIRYVKGTEQARSVGETGKERLIKFLEG